MKKCAKCGGVNIVQLYWVDPNEVIAIDEFNSSNNCEKNDKYCSDCMDFVEFIDED